ncbi:hypothetical protein [Demequina zhanjiangensis]|uniref:DUF2510 domain-containing protein n=1 Tax=Demequina zhanjiangensis TaxID=3051659 RepID=A0ABT8G2U6_9MICO|nr:hypothetical protein [Demequina sp. SYSU T00b26]MDN4473471.1 hypothetical protein [Demequina sp. SYSU T00b26]
MSDQTPANWVTDPTDPTGARRRYWDGSQWTDWVMLPGQEQPTQLSVADAQAAAANHAAAPQATTPDPAAAQPADAHMQSSPTERIEYTSTPDAQSIPYTTVPDSTMSQSGYAAQPAEPKKSRTGLILGIVGGVVALLILGGVLAGIAANRATSALEDAAQEVVDEWEDAVDDLATAEPFQTEDSTTEEEPADDSDDSNAPADGTVVSPQEVAAMSRGDYTAYAASVQTAMSEQEWDGMFYLVDGDTAGDLYVGMLNTIGSDSFTDDEALDLAYAACQGMTDETMADATTYGEFINDVLTDQGYDIFEDVDALMATSFAYVLCPEWTDTILDMGNL